MSSIYDIGVGHRQAEYQILVCQHKRKRLGNLQRGYREYHPEGTDAYKGRAGKDADIRFGFCGACTGDIIRLDKHVDEELDIYVSDIRKFTALPGSVGDDYAVRITSVIREED